MIALYLFALLVLGVYSYSQIDLNLTLLQTPWFLSFQHLMIQLGYYNRFFSAAIFTVITAVLFILYILFLRKSVYNVRILICGIVIITLFSYPAFSHDFFNYIFDARIITHYGQNPYLFKALDFPTDTWIRFMHWTHRTYPYGPFWLILTVPFSYFGLGKFILTLLNFKLLFAASYLGSVFLIKKILEKINPKFVSAGVIFFAVNPLVIIETLISPHLDAIMTFFLLLAIFFLVSQKKVFAIFLLLISAGTKFLTIILLPVFLLPGISIKKVLWFSLILLLAVLIPVIGQRESYPWYFLPPLAIVALLVENKKLVYLAIAATFGLLLRYSIFLYVGQEVLFWENILTIIPMLICVLGIIFYRSR